jgi:FkbM family methyltransferase
MITFLRHFAGRLKRRLFPPPPPPPHAPTDDIAELFQGKSIVLVKIGSNDGVQGDPLRDLIQQNPQWIVLFIEPIKAVYERLIRNYPSGGVYRFENVAIADQPGTKPFYYVSDAIKQEMPSTPWWYDQLGSFDRNHIIKHGTTFEPFIVTEEVRCETLAAILDKHDLTSRVDVIHIDTEGYDYEILKQLDLSSSKLRVVLYEYQHLIEADAAAAEAFLQAAGYTIKRYWPDTLAIR